jgi:hypothetical protein
MLPGGIENLCLTLSVKFIVKSNRCLNVVILEVLERITFFTSVELKLIEVIPGTKFAERGIWHHQDIGNVESANVGG